MCAVVMAGCAILPARGLQAVDSTPTSDVGAAGMAAPAAAVLSGSVIDEDGDAVNGAQVSATAGSVKLKAVTDDAGRFAFTLAGGTQTVTVTVVAQGFVANSVTTTLGNAEQKVLPAIVVVAGDEESVEAISQVQQAQIEVKQEEKQRLLGVVPNFYVSYSMDAQPLTARQKYGLAWRTVIDPVSWAINAGVAGINQADNALPGYGQGWSGYGKRFGAASGDFLIGTYMGGAVLPVLFHQDPRYFYKGTGSVMSRTLYALSTAVISRGDNGKWQPGYASVLGDFTAGAASNLYYPKGSRNGWSLTLENGLLSIGLDGVGNLVQEFVLKHVTPSARKTAP
jgi:hypothetical protein